MKFDDLVTKLIKDISPLGPVQSTIRLSARATIEALGFQVAADGAIVQLAVREWQPPGGLERPKRYPGRRKR